jgi:hypothetical protein
MRRRVSKIGGVRRVELNARELRTVDETAKVWEEPDQFLSIPPLQETRPSLRDCILRLQPPEWADPAMVRQVRDAMLKMGAAAVRIDAPTRASTVTASTSPEPPSDRTLRQVVEQMVAEANTRDRGALAAVVEGAMAGAGL